MSRPWPGSAWMLNLILMPDSSSKKTQAWDQEEKEYATIAVLFAEVLWWNIKDRFTGLGHLGSTV
jgi:hypothetical protein